MDATNIQSMLAQLGCQKIRIGSTGWVYATCPLATWNHAGGHDNNPSFAVAVEDDGGSAYKCHGCQTAGTLKSLVWQLARKAHWEPEKLGSLMNFVNDHDAPSIERLKERIKRVSAWGIQKASVGGIVVSNPSFQLKMQAEVDDQIPESSLETFDPLPPKVRKHLIEERRFTNETLDFFGVRWHAAASRIAVPVRDCKQRLVCVTGRIFPDGKPKWLHTTGFRKEFYLYGEHLIGDAGAKTCYLVEGPFDVMALHQHGYKNGLAVLGSSLSPIQLEKILRWFKEVVIVPDGDAPGKKTADQMYASLSSRLSCRIAKMPDGKDPDDLTDAELESILGGPDKS